uniref:Uncharacterized protein n=1 Tax=Arundo donax TaxID=35708 RepID=A0A0A9LF30_ARUDO
MAKLSYFLSYSNHLFLHWDPPTEMCRLELAC